MQASGGVAQNQEVCGSNGPAGVERETGAATRSADQGEESCFFKA